MVQSKEELTLLLEKVANRMKNLKNDGFQEKYPIGLIDINLWEWPQGVGIYGLYKYYLDTKNPEILEFLIRWFDARIEEGLPEKNVNTMAPMLTLIGVYEITKNEKYLSLCKEWSAWIMDGMIRTGDGALQHMITGDPNDGQILIDTLFMTCLFLTRAGVVLNKPEYIEEAKKQFLIHIKYLYDKKCGLYYHGWDFNGYHNYGEVHWARGNSWYACGLVDFLEMVEVERGLKEYLLDTFRAQVSALEKYQSAEGLWHTIIDDETSYLETSATAAFGYGILKGVRKGYLDKKYLSMGLKALEGVISQIEEDGTVQGVSYGTPVGNDSQFYRDIPVCPMTYGQALTILLLTEALKIA
jgi:unsaturated rhamnogalacturonyl hydrolase